MFTIWIIHQDRDFISSLKYSMALERLPSVKLVFLEPNEASLMFHCEASWIFADSHLRNQLEFLDRWNKPCTWIEEPTDLNEGSVHKLMPASKWVMIFNSLIKRPSAENGRIQSGCHVTMLLSLSSPLWGNELIEQYCLEKHSKSSYVKVIDFIPLNPCKLPGLTKPWLHPVDLLQLKSDSIEELMEQELKLTGEVICHCSLSNAPLLEYLANRSDAIVMAHPALISEDQSLPMLLQWFQRYNGGQSIYLCGKFHEDWQESLGLQWITDLNAVKRGVNA